ncbi:type II toxin-antitoxin system HicA family toxin [Candidatus Berkelbacteria bacterium]|nr:type II toxin-antitoxin system HicA family toxin [Candidatus Berkelbacteria bacterium]
MAAKLPRISPKRILAILEKHGFTVDHVTGSHWILYHPVTERRVTLPFHTRSLPVGTIHSIWKQSGLSRDEFR